jgi:hypothetical protein
MFYLIGVNHNAQRHPPGATLDTDQAELQRCLEEAIDKYRPRLIAVEESDDTLFDRRSGITYESIPRSVAQRHRIDPMFCEPSDDEKKRIGYNDKSQIQLELFTSGLLRDCPSGLEGAAAHAVEVAVIFPIREEHWVQKLKEHLHSEVVFVLGEDHIEGFSGRLQARGVQSKVIFRNIGVSDAQKVESKAARRFPIENPDLFCAMLQQMGGKP